MVLELSSLPSLPTVTTCQKQPALVEFCAQTMRAEMDSMTELHMSRGTGKEAGLSRSHGPLTSLSTGESHHLSHLSLRSGSAVTLPHRTLREQTTSMCFLSELH